MPKTATQQEITYTGIPASPGIALGPIHVIARGFSAHSATIAMSEACMKKPTKKGTK